VTSPAAPPISALVQSPAGAVTKSTVTEPDGGTSTAHAKLAVMTAATNPIMIFFIVLILFIALFPFIIPFSVYHLTLAITRVCIWVIIVIYNLEFISLPFEIG
jgi:hypothetical protein